MYKVIIISVLLAFVGWAWAEELTLSSPVVRGTRTSWQVSQVVINYDLPEVTIILRSPSTAEMTTCVERSGANALIRSFNDDDLTNNSLQKRMLTHAQSVACIGAGTVTGEPY